MSLFDMIANFSGKILKESLTDMIRLETVVDDETMLLKDGTLVSLIRLNGALRNLGEDEMMGVVEEFRLMLSPYLSMPGHQLEINFMRDAASAARYMDRMVARSKRSARQLGLSLDDVLQERGSRLPKFLVSENCLLTVYTRLSAIDKEESATDAKAMAKRMAELPVMDTAQKPGKQLDSLHERHRSLVVAIRDGLNMLGQVSEILTTREALQEIRAALYPETYPIKDEWEPVLPPWSRDTSRSNPGKRIMDMMPTNPKQMGGEDFSHAGVPTLDHQLATMDCEVENSRTVWVGNTPFTSFDMTLAPEVLPFFNNLVADINSKDSSTPWRTSIRVESGGVQAQSMKLLYLAIFTWASPSRNKRIREAIALNAEINGNLDTVVRFRMSFSTWASDGKLETLRRNAQIVSGAVKRWGNAGVDGISGDPLATTISTLPGVTAASTAPVASSPLAHALAMMPFARQASPWDAGSITFRTPMGKPWPYQPGSSKQTNWNMAIVGPPGYGKSVLMNALNFAAAITPSAGVGDKVLLPRVAMTDIGSSSSGVVSLIREALPPHRRHEVLFQRLRNDVDHAINIFDTQLGMRRPLSGERTYQMNFLSLVMSDGEKSPSGPMRGLIAASIDKAYNLKSDYESPNRYLRSENDMIDRVLDDLDFLPDHEATWWDVVDFLMISGRIAEASIANRYAVPTLSDLVIAILEPQIASIYGKVSDPETGEPILNAFQRIISEVVMSYPMLAGTTRYSIGAARIVSLDLMDVTAKGAGPAARKQTAMMYMLARQIMTRDFFVDDEEIEAMLHRGDLPSIYGEYHLDNARINRQVPKLICMDEFHRCGGIEAITDQLLQDAREGRKFNVEIKVASQLIQDFPPAILEILSGLVVCNAGSEASIDYIDDIFKLSQHERSIIRNNLTGPSSRGAPVWCLFKTSEYGEVRQELLLTLGPAELWAYSTTANDVVLRTKLYERIGPQAARAVLAARFPTGSARREVETRKERLEERGERVDDNSNANIIDQLVAELIEQSFIMSKILV